MGRGYRRGGYKGNRYSRPTPRYIEYDESSEDRPDFDDTFMAPGSSKHGGYNAKYHHNSRYPTASKKTHAFQKQVAQPNPFQQSSSHTHHNEQQSSEQSSQQDGIHHYHHHNHYYHRPDGASPLPTQTATGTNNDIMMTDFSAINVLEGRFSKLGSEIVEFLNAMASQSNQTKEFVESFVNYLKQSNPDSELGKILGGNLSQQNRPQAPVIAPAAPSVTPPTAPASTPAGPKAAPGPSPLGSNAFGKRKTPGSSVDSNDGRNMTPILKNNTPVWGSR
ncbi:hypothetical protein F4813DRAFT_398046 [Daldinia decipiens]|uniref:uncharacterized protein n=1 Tax=Daldinia decipiens TaxID=326647 RepID=UPI0020C54093|nr:uncharacterized protein F4813DRAFT_398046 [Daldinia decipiens]KAI1655626.1 hypothetical protein F4813DRAFT_398046 [Daldinia decipiens]